MLSLRGSVGYITRSTRVDGSTERALASASSRFELTTKEGRRRYCYDTPTMPHSNEETVQVGGVDRQRYPFIVVQACITVCTGIVHPAHSSHVPRSFCHSPIILVAVVRHPYE